jgi:cytochrome c-type biogenesis protein CcmE
MKRKLKYIIGIAIIAICIVLLAFRGFRKSQVFYFTVSEALEQHDTTTQKSIRVNGMVVSGSIEYAAEKLMLAFDITDGEKTIPVTYQGAKPDLLTDGKEVVVEGTLGVEGVFNAEKIITKCPSKYKSQ